MIEWRDIPGMPGYQASSDGEIRSLPRLDSVGRPIPGVVLKAHVRPRGDKTVAPSVGGRSVTRFVHHLVALAFHGPMPAGQEVAHNDGDASNCRPDNLRYATHAENEADKELHGTKFRAAGERNGHAKLNEADVRNVLRRLAAGESQAACARDLHVDPSLISHIKRGVHWAHLKEQPNV